MLKIFKAYRIPDTIAQAINVMYGNTKAEVAGTDAFEILVGVHQGDTMKPYISSSLLCHKDGYLEWWGHARLWSQSHPEEAGVILQK